MHLKTIFTCVLVLWVVNSSACLNIFAIDAGGRVSYLEHSFFFSVDFNKKVLQKEIKKLEKKFKTHKFDFKNVSDYGAFLLMSGHYKEGLELFTGLIRNHSDVYEIRSNIAVAYELNGSFDSAYFWEKKAIELNPGAHDNSEWIHLKILEARIKTAADSNWCLHNNITGIEDSVKMHYKHSLHENANGMWLFENFMSQLDERFPFTKPEDKVMGKFIMELGNAYQVVSVNRAYYCYAIAKYLSPLFDESADEKMRIIKSNYPKKTVTDGVNIITLPNKPVAGDAREMLLPNDTDIYNFIQKLNFRHFINPVIYKMPAINILISKV